MLKFGGFKATLNFSVNGRKKKKEQENIASIGSFTGAYRTNRDEFFGYSNIEGQRQTITVMPAELQPRPERPIRAIKSTSDLTRDKNLPENLRQSNPSISQDPRGPGPNELGKDSNGKTTKQKVTPVKLQAEKRLEKRRLEEQKKLEKQRATELKKQEKERIEQEKKREKLALQEQVKQEKLRKENEKKEAIQNKKDKKKAPTKPLANPLAQATSSQPQPVSRNKNQAPSQPQAVSKNTNEGTTQYSSNTLESSISRSSGPPPYESKKASALASENDGGNVSFSKPVDTGSWDMISQHREQLNRAIIKEGQKRQMTMDLNYKVGTDKDNSEV